MSMSEKEKLQEKLNNYYGEENKKKQGEGQKVQENIKNEDQENDKEKVVNIDDKYIQSEEKEEGKKEKSKSSKDIVEFIAYLSSMGMNEDQREEYKKELESKVVPILDALNINELDFISDMQNLSRNQKIFILLAVLGGYGFICRRKILDQKEEG